MCIQGHNRYWSNETTYATQNGGPYNFLFNNKSGQWGHIGVPTEQEFWDFLMETSKRWGLVVYEQVSGWAAALCCERASEGVAVVACAGLAECRVRQC